MNMKDLRRFDVAELDKEDKVLEDRDTNIRRFKRLEEKYNKKIEKESKKT